MVSTRKTRRVNVLKLEGDQSNHFSSVLKTEDGDATCPCKNEREASAIPKPEADWERKPKVEDIKSEPRATSLGLNKAKKEEDEDVKMEEHSCSYCGAQLVPQRETPAQAFDTINEKKSDVTYVDPCPPRKRQRLIMEAVELPASKYTAKARVSTPPRSQPQEHRGQSQTHDPVSEATPAADGSFEALVQKMKNPKVKKKKEAFTLSLDSIKARLEPIGFDVHPTGMDKNITETYFPRYFISAVWGGNPQETFPQPRPELLAQHGLNDWMCITLDHHPHGPEVPGAPGLYFSPGDSDDENVLTTQTFRVLIRIGPSKWQYMGQYTLLPSQSLTNEEWASQSNKCRQAWAKEIYEKEWGVDLRAEVYLHKQLRRTPCEDEIQTDMILRDAYNKSKKKKVYQDLITTDDISAAIAGGLIVGPMGVYSMKCIGYDTKFSQDVHDKLPGWEIEVAERKEEKRLQKEAMALAAENGLEPQDVKVKENRRKRKRHGEDESDGHLEFGSGSELEFEGQASEDHIVRFKGTRTRPIVL